MMERRDTEAMQSSSPSTCVSETLALMLRISRAFGIAPISFQKTGTDPPKITARVSRRYAIYGYVLMTIINLLEIIPTYIYWIEQNDIIGIIMNTFDSSGLMLITSMGAYGAFGRMSRMLHHFDELNKINSKQTAVKTKIRTEKIVTMIIAPILVVHLVMGISVVVIEGLENSSQFVYIIFAVQSFICTLVVAQIILILSVVVTTLETLLLQLQKLPSLVEIEDTRTNNLSVIISSINLDKARKRYFQQICESYEVVCGVVRDLNHTEGVLLFSTIAASTLYCIVSIFNLINIAVLDGEETTLYITREVCWVISIIILLTTFVELCHQAEQKALKIRYLLSDALPEVLATSPVKRWSFKMAVHCDVFLLNRLVFAPLDIVELNRSLVAKVISFVASSLLIIVQYKMTVQQQETT